MSFPAGNRTGAGGSRATGFQMERYPEVQTVGRTFINMVPGIAAFVKPGLGQQSGQRFMKELPDRAVVTWNFSEGAGGIQAFTWVRTVNRVQTVLHKNGVIELSYNDVSARDARRRCVPDGHRRRREILCDDSRRRGRRGRPKPRCEEREALGHRRPVPQGHDRDARRRASGRRSGDQRRDLSSRVQQEWAGV